MQYLLPVGREPNLNMPWFAVRDGVLSANPFLFLEQYLTVKFPAWELPP